jgi:hypothetical protein
MKLLLKLVITVIFLAVIVWRLEDPHQLGQLLGLGHYQNRSYGAAVTHLHLVCFAYALLTHLHMMRHGAQGQRIRERAAEWSIATAQDQLRGLLWDDVIAHLQEQYHDKSMRTALGRLRVA